MPTTDEAPTGGSWTSISLCLLDSLSAFCKPWISRRRSKAVKRQPGVGARRCWRHGLARRSLLVFFADDIKGTAHTSSGLTHQTLALLSYAAVCLGMVSTTLAVRLDQRFRGIAPLLMLVSLGAVVGFFLWGGANATPHSLSGLFQRIFLGCVLIWFGLSANRIRVLQPFFDRSRQLKTKRPMVRRLRGVGCTPQWLR